MKTLEQIAKEVFEQEMSKRPRVNETSSLVLNCQMQGNITSCDSCDCDEYECMDNLIFAYATLVREDITIKM